ncbi:lanthionine synthetase C family protein [Silvanigrella sp.]|jgi:hypothetical protein|uniref:lanthionine synthetase C family protein n=1 Tax=Silvanigrella sp. TaxID=2024976 RepID=UPI0037C60F12
MFHNIILEFAERLENLKYLDDYFMTSNEQKKLSFMTTIAEGFPAISLFYSQLNLINSNQKHKKLLHLYLEKSIAGFQNKTLNTNISIFTGITGLCFVVWISSENGKQYQGLLEKLDSILFHFLDSSLKSFEEKIFFIPSDYDVIQGLSGVIRYLILRKNNKIHEKYLKSCLQIMIKISSNIQYENEMVPGWFFTKEEGISYLESFKGTFNFGLSHGVSGILATLSISKLNGIEIDEMENSIYRIKNWILKWTLKDKFGEYWPNKISLEEQISNKFISNQNIHCRQAWCYGVPGVSRSLYLAGKALSDIELQERAAKAFLEIETRPEEEWRCFSPTFCHVFAGLLQISKRFYVDTKNENFLIFEKKLENRILDFYFQSSPLLFKEREKKEDCLQDLKNIGIIEGAVGTLLSLLHPDQLDNCVWDYPFLIS